MISVQEIEDGNCSVNDAADLMMRLQIARTALDYIAKIAASNEERALHEIHEVASNQWARIYSDHEESCCGEVTLDDSGVYTCKCALIASGEAEQYAKP